MALNIATLRKISELVFSRRTRAWVFGLLLAAITIFAYRPAWNGGFLWDDDDYIIKNDLLTASDGLQRIWFSLDSPSQYFPLVYTTFRIERALWGVNPTGYHWVNLVLHVANALLVWRVLARLNVPGSWLAGAIFALHPVQVESVAWITERKNVLMGFFFLLTLLAWIAFIDKRTKRPWRFYGLALIFYLLALSAKSAACTLPAALLLVLWLQKKPINKRRLLQIVPFVIMGIGMGLLAVWWERYHQGTSRAVFTFLGPMERVLVASRAVWFYLSKLIWPADLTFIYPKWTISSTHLGNYIWLLAGIGLCVAIYFSRRDPQPSPWLHHAFYISLYLCGGPLSVSGVYRADCARISRRSQSRPHIQAASWLDLKRRGVCGGNPGGLDVAAIRDVRQHRNAVAHHSGKKPRMLDGPHQPWHRTSPERPAR